MNRRTFILTSLFVTIAGGLAAVEPGEALPVTKLSQLTTAFEGIVRAGSLVLYEGLPHPTGERELFQREKDTQEVVQIGGEPFYRTPLEVKPGDEELLRRFCSSAESFAVYSGSKRCGGFHADYCLQWQDGDVKWQVLVCFGCQEVKFYGPDTALRADVDREVFKRLQALLGKYRVKRPNPREASTARSESPTFHRNLGSVAPWPHDIPFRASKCPAQPLL